MMIAEITNAQRAMMPVIAESKSLNRMTEEEGARLRQMMEEGIMPAEAAKSFPQYEHGYVAKRGARIRQELKGKRYGNQ